MFGIGGFELFIILLFGFLVFGPDKLPEVAKTIGAALSKFKAAQEEMNQVIKTEVIETQKTAMKQADEAEAGIDTVPAQESFAERKARYDKERAERKKREEIEANRAAMKEKAASAARAYQEEVTSAPAKPEPRNFSTETSAPVISQGLTADELYGNKPVMPTKKAPSAAAEGKGE